jgi:hypothetical protein
MAHISRLVAAGGSRAALLILVYVEHGGGGGGEQGGGELGLQSVLRSADMVHISGLVAAGGRAVWRGGRVCVWGGGYRFCPWVSASTAGTWWKGRQKRGAAKVVLTLYVLRVGFSPCVHSPVMET